LNARLLATLRATGSALLRLPRAWSPLLVVSWMLCIWWLSSLSVGAGSGVLRRIHFLTNLAHAGEYGLLALWLLLCLPRGGQWVELTHSRALAVWTIAVAYAVSDEIHQSYVPGRDGTPFDVLTDSIGAACVLWIVLYVSSSRADGPGLTRRLALGLSACLASAALAANHQRLFGF
jgi:VanZ family protein